VWLLDYRAWEGLFILSKFDGKRVARVSNHGCVLFSRRAGGRWLS
jgi:hypothetical protein